MSIKTRLENRYPNVARLYWPCRSLFRVRSIAEVKFLLYFARFIRRSRSQAMQDVFALWAERESSVKRAGLPPAFVEVGANDPEIGSNTFLLEKRGWTGLLVEPNPKLATRLKSNRRAAVHQFASSRESGNELWLRVPTKASGKANVSDSPDFPDAVSDIEAFRVTTRRLSEMIDEENLSGHALFLSVDVEGHELEVLDGIDFGRHRFFAITIEHNFDTEKISLYQTRLSLHGFEQVFPRLSWFDAWFVRTQD